MQANVKIIFAEYKITYFDSAGVCFVKTHVALRKLIIVQLWSRSVKLS